MPSKSRASAGPRQKRKDGHAGTVEHLNHPCGHCADTVRTQPTPEGHGKPEHGHPGTSGKLVIEWTADL